MTITESKRLVSDYYKISLPDEEDDFRFTEALGFIIETNRDPQAMMELGGWYYDKKIFDLALKYYEMAAEYKYEGAYVCLGYIWYYGRTGERDFEKAFKYYSLAADAGDYEAAYKVADMYKNGYYVEKDEEKYKSLIISSEPYTYKYLLEDDDAVDEKKRELEKEIEEYGAYKAELTARLEEIKGGM